MYGFISGKKALLIDCFRDDELRELFIQNDISDLTVVLTHEHWDHASGVEWVRKLVPHCKIFCGVYAKENLEDSRKNMSGAYKVNITVRQSRQSGVA